MSSSNTKASTGRWEFLDSLRAIAALLVMVDHWLQVYISHAAPIWHFISLGGTGVAVFFLVSGFIIPVNLEKYGSLRTFWVGRLFRLFPLYLSSLGISYVLRSLGVLPPLPAAPIWRSLIGNGLMAQELFRVPYPLAVYWSLSYEGIFYICCSILFVFGALSSSRLWSIVFSGGFILATLGADLGFHHGLSAEKAGVLVTAFFGTVLFRYTTNKESFYGVALSGILLATAIIVCFWFRLIHFPKQTDAQFPGAGYQAMVSAWGLALLLFSVCLSLRRFQFPKLLLWIGQISYSVYLIHPVVLELCKERFHAVASIPIFVLGTLAIAQLTFTLIEDPFQRLQHKLFPRKSRVDPPSLTSVAKA